MPLNPSIALQSQATPMRSPFQTLGEMSQLRSYQEDQKQRQIMNQQENERRDLMLRDRRNAEEDQGVFQGLVQQHGNIDDALDEMDNQGRSEFAVGLRGKVNAERLKGLDNVKKLGENQLQALKTVGQIWSGVSDNGTHQTAIPASRAMFKAVGLDPALIDHMGQQYDEKTTPKLIEDAMKWGGQQQDVLNARKAAYDSADQGIKVAKDARERDDYFTKSLASYLPTVKAQEEWTGALDNAAMMGASPQTRAKFGETFSPEASARARSIGLTPKESQDVPSDAKRLSFEGQRVALERRRVALAEKEAKDAASGAPGTGRGRSLTANAEELITDQQKKEHAALQKEINDPDKGYIVTKTKGSDGKWYEDPAAMPEGVKTTAETRNDVSDAAKPGITQRKLEIEDGYRARRGMPSMLQSEIQFATDPTKSKELRILRNKYKLLTDQQMPLERLAKLKDAYAAEKDPDRKEAIRQEVADLRDQIRAAGGR